MKPRGARKKRNRSQSVSAGSEESQGRGNRHKRLPTMEPTPSTSFTAPTTIAAAPPAPSTSASATLPPSSAPLAPPALSAMHPPTRVRSPEATPQILPSFTTRNPFGVLQNDQEVAHSETVKPPPIFIKGVTNFSDLVTTIKTILGEEKFTCKARLSDVAVQASTPDGYRTIIRHLKATETQYFTYQLKEDKAFRVVIRHLHPTTAPEDIKSELTKLGYHTRSVTNVLHPVTKVKLPLFFVDLEPASTNKQIFNLKELYYCKIAVEEPHKRQEVVQCKRCQNYGHTASYCGLLYRCLKCPGQHPTAECTKKDRSETATCVLCGGPHPANYKGCEVHKKLQRSMRTKNQTNITKHHSGHPAPTLTSSNFPSLQRPNPEVSAFNTPHPTPISYASAAATVSSPSPPSPPQPQIQPFIPPATSRIDFTQIQHALQSFLNEFKKVIEPLLQALQALSTITSILPSLHTPK